MTFDNHPPARRLKWRSTALILGAVLMGAWLLYSGPKTAPEEEVRQPKSVKTIQAHPSRQRITVRAYGTVIPSQTVTLEPEVTGQIVRHHPALIPGGNISKGEELFAIDPRLTELSLEESQAMVDRVQTTLLEAQRKRDETRNLVSQSVLSPTELAEQESDVMIQDAELKRLTASMNRTKELLRRHTLFAPFNAIVLEESVEIGQRVEPGFAAATLVGTDTFWVRASLPVDQLRWIPPLDASPAKADAAVYLDTGNGPAERRPGKVIRLLGDIQPTGRMARLLISVPSPLTGATPHQVPLLLGSYVRVEIDAGHLENVYALDRTALRDDNRVWIVNSNSELEIRVVNVAWTRDETIFIDRGLNPGDQVIVSPLRVALPGMKVRAVAPPPPDGKVTRL